MKKGQREEEGGRHPAAAPRSLAGPGGCPRGHRPALRVLWPCMTTAGDSKANIFPRHCPPCPQGPEEF